MTGQLEAYLRVYSKLKLDIVGDDFSLKLNTSRQTNSENEATGTTKSGEIQKIMMLVASRDSEVQSGCSILCSHLEGIKKDIFNTQHLIIYLHTTRFCILVSFQLKMSV